MNDGRYFRTTRRGEIHELQEELHSTNKDKKKEAVKKVIAAMTVGKDVGKLFPDVVNCMQTNNIELKKLVYLYIINYAKSEPTKAILAINTFRKDSGDPNPLIRALAVRTMGCIRLEEITEYLVEPLRRCCKDHDPYVRKTAALCVAKLHNTSPHAVEDQGFVQILHDMLADSNPMVVANSVAALMEMSCTSAKNYLQLKEQSVLKLLAALNECSEWGQVFILDAIALYNPSSSREVESILERVTARLSHANAAVVMSAVKVVMKFLDRVNNTELVRSLQKKLSAPLVTLLSSEPEIQYVALRAISLIVQKRPTILAEQVKMFFCKYNDPMYVKVEKLDIMVRLVSEANVEQLLSELKEYAAGVDVEFVRKAVRAIGRSAIKLDRAADRCVNALVELIESGVNYVVQEAVVVIADIFRKYPSRYERLIGTLCAGLDTLNEAESKAAMVWIIGEYAEKIENASEMLTLFLDGFSDEPAMVQLQILTAFVKLYLKAPSAESQKLVTSALKLSTEKSDNPDLRDRGYIYWRLLSSNAETTKKVVLADKKTITDNTFLLDPHLLDKFIENISSLSSVYLKLPETFIVSMRGKASNDSDTDASSDPDESVDTMRRQIEAGGGGSGDERRGRKGSQRRGEESASEEGSESGSSEADGESGGGGVGGGGGNLLDLDDDSSTPTSSQISVEKHLVLGAHQPGSNGKTGLQIQSALGRQKSLITMHISVTNQGNAPLRDWAIQFNKNPFGLAPQSPLQLGEVLPGQSASTILPVVANQLLSNNPPQSPLELPVAVKTNVDVFYFAQPFSLAIVLELRDALEKHVFRDHWQRMGEAGSAKQLSSMCQAPNTIASQHLVAKLRPLNISLVAQRNAETFDVLYFSCVTTNNLLVLSELSLQKSPGVGVKICIRADAAPLMPLFQALLISLVQLRVVQ
eukprot:GHVN01056059.1.p1 GENE.GHVN01056059.1~~GHVN01056059.1.p1  ORF type:complete len:925 (-),score=148.10 GHVN01056059.1:712-3486(-)